MKKEDAENIQTVTQGCIRELNMLLRIYEQVIDEAEFKILKSDIAQAMGRIIDIEEFSVYKDYPELRSYKQLGEE